MSLSPSFLRLNSFKVFSVLGDSSNKPVQLIEFLQCFWESN